MKLKAKEKKGIVEVKLLLDSPMVGKEEAEIKKIDVDFLTHVTAKVNGNVVWEASTGPFLSKNPYFKFAYKGAKGDKVVVETIDNKGETKSDTVEVK